MSIWNWHSDQNINKLLELEKENKDLKKRNKELLELVESLMGPEKSIIDFEDVSEDTHEIVDLYCLNGLYTVPVDGRYLVEYRYAELEIEAKKGNKIYLRDAKSVSRIG